MTFADITIVPVSAARKVAYLAFSRRMADIYRAHGATRIIDYWQADGFVNQASFHADGVAYGEGELADFARIAGALESESVVVTITEWPSREARDRGTAAATSDPRVLATLDEEPVFDGSRLIATSFEVVLSVDKMDEFQ
jgi:uncharacterized protein YbaA (DUF1428 family)